MRERKSKKERDNPLAQLDDPINCPQKALERERERESEKESKRDNP